LTIITYGQDYFPLIEENKTWNVLAVAFQPPFDTSFSTITYKVSGDTIINSESYKKIYSSNEENPANWNLWCFMREDANKKVWSRLPGSYSENQMYDFDVSVGDTVMSGLGEIVSLKIDSISDILVNQEIRNKYWLSCIEFPDYKETWIEGVGSNKGICWSGSAFIVGGWYWFLCMSENGELIYMNPNYESCYLITDINEIEKTILKVFPNPTKNTLTIENIEHIEIESISLLNTNGQIIKQFDSKNTQLDLSNISSGLFLLKISYNNGELIEKILIE
jgi:hypothetical protein